MKIQILQENLSKGLNTVSRIISSKAQLPILSNVLLRATSEGLTLSATNLEAGVKINLGSKIEEEGEITIPARFLTEVVSNLPAGKVELETEGNLLKLSTDSYRATFNGIPATEFPELPSYSDEGMISLPSDKLLNAINQVVFAAATDDTRPVLTGVLFRLINKTLTMVATDGYRLSLKTIELEEETKEDVSLILPARSLSEVSRIALEEGKEVDMIKMGSTKDKNQVVFIFPRMELFTRVIEGEFPEYEKIIPEKYETKVLVDRESFNRGLKVVSIFARESSNIVKMKYRGEFLELSANSPQVGENRNLLEAKVEGEEGEIAFNYRFLSSFLAAVETQEVSLEFSGSLNPGIFRSVGDESFLHIIMPIRLQEEE